MGSEEEWRRVDRPARSEEATAGSMVVRGAIMWLSLVLEVEAENCSCFKVSLLATSSTVASSHWLTVSRQSIHCPLNQRFVVLDFDFSGCDDEEGGGGGSLLSSSHSSHSSSAKIC